MINYTYHDLNDLVDSVQKMCAESSQRADALQGKSELESLMKLATEVGFMNACGAFVAKINEQIDAMQKRTIQ